MNTRPRGLGKRAWIWTRLLRSILIALAKFRVFRVIVRNRQVVPKTGGALIACNHISWADPVFLWGALRRNAVAMAMAELWVKPHFRMVVEALGQVPVKRRDPVSGQQASEAIERVLEHDGLAVIFPEGKCATGYTMLPFQRGVARISMKTGKPVIPAGVWGTNRVLPLTSKKINRRADVIVTFGEPLHPQDFDTVDRFLEAIEDAVSSLSGRPPAVVR